MINILIKSFNRPFYLERCIKSIQENVLGNYQILVLDDGTPEKYLKKLQEKFPKIIIKKSEQYNEKVEAIEENLKSGKEINGFKIPTELWIEAAKNASEYFIMIEDDVWFTDKINLDEIVIELQKNNIQLLKLGWLGNPNLSSKHQNISEKINREIPKFITTTQPFLDWIFQDKYRFYSLLKKLKFVKPNAFYDYYVLNSIAMGFYQKNYWLAIWSDFTNEVNEKKQLLNAISYYNKHKGQNFLARFHQEIMKTTFSSSATNSYHKYNIDLNINKVNHILNEEWLSGNLDSMQNFPKDFSDDYIISFFNKNNFSELEINNWKLWTQKFKQQYQQIGCNTD